MRGPIAISLPQCYLGLVAVSWLGLGCVVRSVRYNMFVQLDECSDRLSPARERERASLRMAGRARRLKATMRVRDLSSAMFTSGAESVQGSEGVCSSIDL